jgi:hypothetical protein
MRNRVNKTALTMKKEQIEAGYRVALKRIIRAAVGAVDNEADTTVLEAQVRTIARTAPAVVARGVDGWFKSAAQAWTRGNNSGDSRILEAEDLNCDKLRDRAERVLRLWSVKCDYPGLYPCFTRNGQTYYAAETLFRAIAAQ